MYSWSGKAKDPDSNVEVPSDDVDEFPGWTLHPRWLLTLDLTSHPCQGVDELPPGERQILKVGRLVSRTFVPTVDKTNLTIWPTWNNIICRLFLPSCSRLRNSKTHVLNRVIIEDVCAPETGRNLTNHWS